MKVYTKYYAFIRERLGRSDEEFELEEGSTVADFLKLFSEKYAGKLMGLFDGPVLRKGFAVAVNGENVDLANWKNTRLKDGDVVVVLPPIAGG
jgi:molybdopterin synthase sulfur carrier subunit